jgi:hypothetical protein
MTYACPIWEYAADARLLKLQSLQNRVLRAIENLYRYIQVHELHVALKMSYVYNFATTLCRTWAEVILNHINPNISVIGHGEARHRKYERPKLGGSQTYESSAD